MAVFRYIRKRLALGAIGGLLAGLAAIGQAQAGMIELRGPNDGARVALVIGNAAYEQAPLTNTVNDARLMAATLRQLGYQVRERFNLKRVQLLAALHDFETLLGRHGGVAVALFYYAGHGVGHGGARYLIPIDADIGRMRDVASQSVSLNRALDILAGAKARARVAVLDAMFNDPFAKNPADINAAGADGKRRGMAPDTLIAQAAAPGTYAMDGKGENSPYTGTLASAMMAKNVVWSQVFTMVRAAVISASGGQQLPVETTTLSWPFSFNPVAPPVAR